MNFKRGFTLTEALLAAVVLVMAISAITMPFTAAARNEHVDARRTLAASLAREMMEEILTKPFDDPNGAGAPGPEPGENRWAFSAKYDNIDDYHDYTEPAGEITDFKNEVIDCPAAVGLSREVSTEYVYLTGQDSSQDPTFIRITVVVKYQGNPLVTLTRLVYRMP